MWRADEDLLDLGKQWCPTDYAVRHFRNPAHPQFFGNKGKLLKAVRRAATRLPKSERAQASERIEAAQRVWTTSDEDYRKSVLEAENRLIAALLELNDQQLFDLFTQVDFGDDVEGEDFWLEDLGIAWVPDPGDPEDNEKRPIVPSLHEHLVTLLRGKKRHGNLVWIAAGLATQVTDVRAEGMPDMESISCQFGELADMVKQIK